MYRNQKLKRCCGGRARIVFDMKDRVLQSAEVRVAII